MANQALIVRINGEIMKHRDMSKGTFKALFSLYRLRLRNGVNGGNVTWFELVLREAGMTFEEGDYPFADLQDRYSIRWAWLLEKVGHHNFNRLMSLKGISY